MTRSINGLPQGPVLRIGTPEQISVYVGHIPHVVPNLMLLRGENMFPGECLLPVHFMKQAHIQMGIE